MKTTIEMAREAGAELAELPMMDAFVFSVDDKHWNSKELERFVALVRADERGRMCEQLKECSSEKPTSNEANRSEVLGEGG